MIIQYSEEVEDEIESQISLEIYFRLTNMNMFPHNLYLPKEILYVLKINLATVQKL